jgi:pimeloyl-ACP methyl ester carboxylesterase
MWAPQLEFFARSRRVLAPDLPGFGGSTASFEADSIDELARVVLDDCHGLGAQKAVVAGCSLGGAIALGLQRLDAAFVSALALLNTRTQADSDRAREKRRAVIDQLKVATPPPLLAHALRKNPLCAETLRGALETLLTAKTLEHNAGVVAAVIEMVESATPAGIIAGQQALLTRPEVSAQIKGIQVPAAVIHGCEDSLLSVGDARQTAASFPDARFVPVQHAAHLPNLEQPGAVNAALESLLDRVVLSEQQAPEAG